MTDDMASFTLPDTPKVEDCENLHGFLAAAQGKPISFACGGVERLSGLAAQMLLMAATTWRAQGLDVTFDSPSDGFTRSIAVLGLHDLLSNTQAQA